MNTQHPQDWTRRSVRSLCSKGTLTTPSKEPGRPFEYIDVSAVSGETLAITATTTHTGASAPSRARKQVRNNDILFATIRPTLKRVALVPPNLDGQVASTAFCVLRPDPSVAVPRFLYYAVSADAFIDAVGNLQRGASYPAVSDSDILDQELLVPPIREQRAITSVLEQIQNAIALEEHHAAVLKELKAATMAKVFREGLRGERLTQTNLGALPASWRVLPLGSVSQIGNGSTPSRQNPAYWDGGVIPWITSTKVHDVLIRAADEFVTELAYRECHLPLVPKGSVVIAITGQGKTLGNVAMTLLDTCINQHLAFARIDSNEAVSEFVLYYLQTRYADLRSVGFGGGSTKGALTCSFLKTYPIPLPSVSEQREIADILSMLADRIEVAVRRGAALGKVFSATLQQLMTGTLRVTPLLEHRPNGHA